MQARPRGTWSTVLPVYLAALSAAGVAGSFIGPTRPVAVAFWADIAATLVVFGFSVRYRNSSLYDPFWSVAPPLIVLYWMTIGLVGGFVVLRQFCVLLLVVIWASRLTWNWADRWGGLEDEDFRYRDLKTRHRSLYPLINLTGIHLFPTLLVFAACLPLFPAVSDSVNRFNWLDVVAVLLATAAIVIEATADWQLRAFRRGTDTRGFLQTGLWARSRHPNYFGEICFWWAMYLFGLAANSAWWWSMFGALAITALFWFVSVPMMERRLSERYPRYLEMRRGVPLLIPRLRSGPT